MKIHPLWYRMPKGVYERKSEIARFWEKVDIKTEEECWMWLASKDPDGYGWFSYTSTTATQKHKTVLAHRYSAATRYGDIGTALVRHICDNPSCVNPAHLALGSPADNSADMVERNRSLKGELNHNASLTDEKALAILKKYKEEKEAGRLYGALVRLATEFGVSKQTVSRLTAGKYYSHLVV
jgi:hypothetical protein